MATKKKSKKKTANPKKRASKKVMPKKAAAKKLSTKNLKKQSAKKKKASPKKQIQKKSERSGSAVFLRDRDSRSGEQSGDLQGLSRPESADSESVEELLEEGNAFEADAVLGVEEADLEDGKEVHTHEVPEDDVPDEYLDKD